MVTSLHREIERSINIDIESSSRDDDVTVITNLSSVEASYTVVQGGTYTHMYTHTPQCKGHTHIYTHTMVQSEIQHISIKSNQTLFATCTEYNKYRPYREILTYKPLTNSSVQEELRKYLQNRLK